jgi:hypothetical protein
MLVGTIPALPMGWAAVPFGIAELNRKVREVLDAPRPAI